MKATQREIVSSYLRWLVAALKVSVGLMLALSLPAILLYPLLYGQMESEAFPVEQASLPERIALVVGGGVMFCGLMTTIVTICHALMFVRRMFRTPSP